MRSSLIEPCLPSPAKAPPSGPDWLHEIRHDGFRILAWRDAGHEPRQISPHHGLHLRHVDLSNLLVRGDILRLDEILPREESCQKVQMDGRADD
jgi:hypothetical protein